MFPNRATMSPVRPPAPMSTDKNLERRITAFNDKWQNECRQLRNDHPRLRKLAQESKELLATLSRKGVQEKLPAPYALSGLMATVTGLLGRFSGSRQTREDLQQGMQNFLRMLMQHQVLVFAPSGVSTAGRDGKDRATVGLYAERFMRAVVAAHSADRVSESRELCTTLLASVQDSFSHFGPQSIAAIVWGLGKLAEQGVRPVGQEQAVTRALEQASRQEMPSSAQNISNILLGLANLVRNGIQPDGLKRGVRELLERIEGQAGKVSPRHLSNSLQALARLVENQVRPDGLTTGVNALLKPIVKGASNFNAPDISSSLWALGKLGENRVQPDRLNMGVEQLLKAIPEGAANFDARQISSSLWGLAKLVGNQVRPEGLEMGVKKLLNRIPERAADFEAQGISNCLWALAWLVGNQVQPDRLKTVVTKLVNEIPRQAAYFKAQEISNSLWALGKLAENQVQLDRRDLGLNELLKTIPGRAKDFDAQGISNSLWALGKLVENQVQPDGLEMRVKGLLKTIPGRAADFSAQGIGNSLWALGKLVENQVRPDGLEEGLNALLKRIPGWAKDFKAREISNSLWALAKLAENQVEPDGLEMRVKELLNTIPGRAADFNAQGIANSLWALASMGVITLECPALFEGFFASLEGIDFGEQSKGLLTWALAVAIARQLDTGSIDRKEEQLARKLSHLVHRICVDVSSSDGQLAGRIRNQAGLVLEFLQRKAPLDLGSVLSLDASGYAESCPSETQHRLAGLLRSQVSLKVQEEQGLSVHNAQLPPVDMTVEHKAQDGTKRVYYLEVQGPTHYVKWGGKSIPNGSTLLKRQLYMAALRERNGQGNNGIAEYLEIPVGMCDEFLREAGACEEGQAVAWQKLFERARAGGLYPPSSVEIAGSKDRKPPVSTSIAEADRKPPALAFEAEPGRKSPARSWAAVAGRKSPAPASPSRKSPARSWAAVAGMK